VLALKPDGVFLSNGPGDPERVRMPWIQIRRLMGRMPILAFAWDIQLTGIALRRENFQAEVWTPGGNHPVKQLKTGKIEITGAQPLILRWIRIRCRRAKLNSHYRSERLDFEGLRHRNLPLFSVQYHPRAAPGAA